jgi:small nuclear ribonucleoprotein (snRNP)-like protein
MSGIQNSGNAINKLSSIEANIIEQAIEQNIKVSLDNERAFYGTLKGYDDSYLIMENNGKPILIKRRKVSSLAVV